MTDLRARYVDLLMGCLTRELFPYLLGIFIVTLIITYIPMVSLWLPNILMPE